LSSGGLFYRGKLGQGLGIQGGNSLDEDVWDQRFELRASTQAGAAVTLVPMPRPKKIRSSTMCFIFCHMT